MCLIDQSHANDEDNNAETINFKDRKSTRLNSSHQIISYAVFCLKKKKKKNKKKKKKRRKKLQKHIKNNRAKYSWTSIHNAVAQTHVVTQLRI